jgi:CBS domain-containing protein
MNVEEILKSKGQSVQTIEADEMRPSPKRSAGSMDLHRLGRWSFVALGQHPFVSMLTERDIIRPLGRHGVKLLTMRVAEVMSRNVPSCAPQENIVRLLRQMTASGYRHLPVVDRVELAGLVSIGDLVKACIANMELETSLLRDLYIARDNVPS